MLHKFHAYNVCQDIMYDHQQLQSNNSTEGFNYNKM